MKPTLSQLSQDEVGEIIKSRIENTKGLHELAMSTKNHIIRDAADLDTLAKSMGMYIEFEEELDPYEDNY